MPTKRTTELFWSRVAIGDIDECWPWLRGQTDGYGEFQAQGISMHAHRWAWALIYGPIPPHSTVRHFVCDNPLCCNFYHLRLGTIADNMADRTLRGRQARGE